ncbi:LETM1-like protein-domain-containing protein [Phycomyces nitens]|nr:LETM1-like protein-domain-containing protein [Phycomyces nitens]
MYRTIQTSAFPAIRPGFLYSDHISRIGHIANASVGATFLIRPLPRSSISLHTFRSFQTAQQARSIRQALPTELRILRAEVSKQPKNPLKIDEKETMTTRAAQLAKEQAAMLTAASEAAGKSVGTVGGSTAAVPSASKPKKTIWQKVKAEAVHYWHGTKLLGLEVRISSKLTWKLLHGSKLTRREARQLRRTTSDIVRLVPFAVFLIVPFMELLLPVALKLFPNMLPSTYESKTVEEEKKRKLLKVRLEMARFLQETIAESGFPGSDSSKAAQEFAEFFRKTRITGEQPSTEDLLNVARRFEDELTLDNLTRPQLVSMCRYMNINAFGSDNFLRFQIRNRMRQIKADDQVIVAEGIDDLTIQELQAACAARGIRTIGTSPGRLRDELSQWLDLHLNHHVPSTLLILSRAFSFTDRHMTTEDALRVTFDSLPDNLVNEAELQVLELVGASTYKQKMEVLEQQQELIEDESEQEEKEAKARRDAKEAIEALEVEKKRVEEQLNQQEAEKRDSFDKDEKPLDKESPKLEDPLTNEEQKELQEALGKLRTKVDLLEERAQLNEIKFHHEGYKELIEDLKEATHREADKSTMRLGKKLEKMLNDIDIELDTLEKDQKQDQKETAS